MKAIINRLKDFFFPPEGLPRWRFVLPYAVLGVLTLVVAIAGAYGWEYTNSPEFCGTACHTMPPEYTAYLTSPHARVDCVECHIGDGFITTRITRKAGDAKHIIRLAFKDYEYPITAQEMRPARQTCELCHFPEKFSTDSLREIKEFSNDRENTPKSLYLVMKTGGGSERLGLGRGIHWHIENPVEYLALDQAEQDIPYVRVINDDGTYTEFMDIEADFSSESLDESLLKEMDCITCHNRISHLVNHPEDILDQLLERGLVSPSIPDIRRLAIELFYREYDSSQLAQNSIAGLKNYYVQYFPEFLAENEQLIDGAIDALQTAYAQSVFPEQKFDWDSHNNNIGHENSPGCFRCHDGKHLDDQNQAIRLECNLCHSIPEVAGPQDFVSTIEISRGPEPESHLNANWIAMHREVFDPTCSSCHTTEDPGGTSNTSFCSNSACHGSVIEYAGFDAPALREILQDQLPPLPEPVVIETPEPGSEVTFENVIGPMLQTLCVSCHGDGGMVGLNLSSYETLMAGSNNGPVVVPGEPENSLIVEKLTGEPPHFAQLSDSQLEFFQEWIANGAVER